MMKALSSVEEGAKMSAVRLVPWMVHQAIEYVAGIFIILAPFLLGFQGQPAFPVFVGVGVIVLVVAILSQGKLGVLDFLPMPVHAVLDYILGFFLVLAPFFFNFENTTAQTTSILLGVAHLVITLLTNFPKEVRAEAT